MRQRKDRYREEFERIREACDIARPGQDGFPDGNFDPVESLPQFFDGTTHLWDRVIGAPRGLHENVAVQIPKTDDPIRILDVGCGTGLEFSHLFDRAPNARIVGIDQAPRMLEQARAKYRERMDRITLIEASCLDWPDLPEPFDYAVSSLTVHHFAPETKVEIYRNIRASLAGGGSTSKETNPAKVESRRCVP